MKVKIGNKEHNFTIRDVIYIFSLVGIGAGWFVDHKITKFKNEMKDQVQDEKIKAQQAEIIELKDVTRKQSDYVEENTKNIFWIVRVLELE